MDRSPKDYCPQGTAGGVYSGQFDIDMDALDRILVAREEQSEPGETQEDLR